jgi:hypothetical protein
VQVLELFHQIASLTAQLHNADPPDLSLFSQLCHTLLTALGTTAIGSSSRSVAKADIR